MARPASRLKLGYYPLVPAEANRIRRFLHFPDEPASVLDPCAGTGAALLAITSESNVRRYGIELDAVRARAAGSALDEVIHGNAFDAHSPVESYSLAFGNPPYDQEIGESRNIRTERLFVEHVGRWVRSGCHASPPLQASGQGEG